MNWTDSSWEGTQIANKDTEKMFNVFSYQAKANQKYTEGLVLWLKWQSIHLASTRQKQNKQKTALKNPWRLCQNSYHQETNKAKHDDSCL
jgi:hypothetical protein